MTTDQQLPYAGALGAVERIEATIAERDTVRDDAKTVLATAQDEADRIVEAARRAGRRSGEQRKRAVLAEAAEHVRAIEAAAQADVARIDRRLDSGRDRLVNALTELVLGDGG